MSDWPLSALLRFGSLASIAAVAAACGHAPTSGANIIVANDAPPDHCERLGHIEGRAATGPLSFQEASRYAERDLREAAARRGATHVQVTHRDEPGVTTVAYAGIAFRCDD